MSEFFSLVDTLAVSDLQVYLSRAGRVEEDGLGSLENGVGFPDFDEFDGGPGGEGRGGEQQEGGQEQGGVFHRGVWKRDEAGDERFRKSGGVTGRAREIWKPRLSVRAFINAGDAT